MHRSLIISNKDLVFHVHIILLCKCSIITVGVLIRESIEYCDSFNIGKKKMTKCDRNIIDEINFFINRFQILRFYCRNPNPWSIRRTVVLSNPQNRNWKKTLAYSLVGRRLLFLSIGKVYPTRDFRMYSNSCWLMFLHVVIWIFCPIASLI